MRLKHAAISFEFASLVITAKDMLTINAALALHGIRVRISVNITPKSIWPEDKPVLCGVALSRTPDVNANTSMSVIRNGTFYPVGYGQQSGRVHQYTTLIPNSTGFVLDYSPPIVTQIDDGGEPGVSAKYEMRFHLPMVHLFIPGIGDDDSAASMITYNFMVQVNGT